MKKNLPRKTPDSNDPVRLQVRLARSGLGSRRKCEEFIAAGRITVNGKIVSRQGIRVFSEDTVAFDGRPLGIEKRKVYIALNKPIGFLCANEDPQGRPLAKNLLEPVIKERIFHVGRLDFMSSGLIFYTNDGDFARAVSHPSNVIEKEYIVLTKRDIPLKFINDFISGITVDGVRYQALSAKILGPRKAKIILVEGKNREIRQVFRSARIGIAKVHRVRIGNVSLWRMPPGRFRHLGQKEIASLLVHKGDTRTHGCGN